ncbi:MAG TPA: S-adenosylmethionine tRNA ribosyltransferase [Marinilabiliaceae bacterium]|nr:S-adenosylmethionine tRNA ribosyltransferase [Marinilabiliaceae bacterium]
MSIPEINISDYQYILPPERIARYPLEKRDDSKLLVYNKGHIAHSAFRQLADFLPDNTLLVFNNTRVIRARLQFKKQSGARVEIFCLEPYQPSDTVLAFQSRSQVQWICMVGNQKKWKEGPVYAQAELGGVTIEIKALVIERLTDGSVIEFSWENKDYSFADILENLGHTPIPPYLEREDEEIDIERYQTVYSKYQGSVAAPTAGLHFTDSIMQVLAEKGIASAELTLHVGAGTFKPVKADSISEHEMHTEHFEVNLPTLTKIASHSGPVIAVGTTSVRTLESLYGAAALLQKQGPYRHIKQWDGLELTSTMTRTDALGHLISELEKQGLKSFKASTSIIIAPGYSFKTVDGIITNFHQPRSTLLLLIAALIGDNWKEVYKQALAHDYRFLSYGDSSLLLR